MKNSKKISVLFSIISLLALTACTPPPPPETTETPEDSNPIETPTPDTTENPILGSWTLQSQIINSPAGTMTHPASGHTLNFKSDGTYYEDYSTETIPDVTVDNPVASVTNHCEISGYVEGKYISEEIFDLDSNESFTSLEILPEGGQKPQIVCETSTGGNGGATSATTVSLGHGPGNNNGYVPYTYTLEENTLVITQKNEATGVTTISTFSK